MTKTEHIKIRDAIGLIITDIDPALRLAVVAEDDRLSASLVDMRTRLEAAQRYHDNKARQ